ncbi:MAG: peptidase [Anaeromyxobacter sp.]
MTTRTLAALALATLLAPLAARADADVIIVNGNAPGVGFNDPTPVAPVGGNPGTTLGEQRLNAFRHAAGIWGATLDSRPDVNVFATFEPLTCTATSAVLGSAGPISVWTDFPGATYAATWYHAALANKLAGQDLDPTAPEIRARFNSNLGSAGCLTGSFWYLGYDTPAPAGQLSLVVVLLHEFAHGLGFSSVTNVSTGALFFGQSDTYSKFYHDELTGQGRDEMTDAQRQASALHSRQVVWSGPHVTDAVPAVLSPGTPVLSVVSAALTSDFPVGAAAFGPPLASPGVTGQMVAALDAANAAGPTTFDACTPLTNAGEVAGRVAVVSRGTCAFTVKVKNAQDAGAIAVVVADNAAGGPPAGMGGADASITIPSVRVTLDAGNAIRAAIAAGPVTGTLGVDPGIRAGTTRSGMAMLYTPSPVQPGSSVSHWDDSTTRNQLMEPAINTDLTTHVAPPYDLTLPLLRDVGWYLDRDLDQVDDDVADRCLGSDLGGTVVVGGIDTGVPNTLFTDGCTIVDRVNACGAGARNHGAYVSCVAGWTNALLGAGYLTDAQKGAIQSAAARNR